MADKFKGKYGRLFPKKVSTTLLIHAYILHILKAQDGVPMYGQEIAAKIKQHTEKRNANDVVVFEGYELSRGTLYGTLRDLEEAKLVTSFWGDTEGNATNRKARNYYTITEDGINALSEMIEQQRKPMQEALHNLNQISNALFAD